MKTETVRLRYGSGNKKYRQYYDEKGETDGIDSIAWVATIWSILEIKLS
jgi:hypothetical protein